MKIIFSDQGWEDFSFWVTNDKKMSKRILSLIKEIQREPFGGIGKPEPLKHDLSGFWSRRINDEQRLVYMVEGDQLLIAQARYHY